jgi:regulatory protein
MAESGALEPGARLDHALGLAFRHLNRRDRTAAEMRRHLEGRGVEPATVEAALRELGDGGYVDDARYAARFVEDRRRLDGWGAERIERRLRDHGVPREVIAGALDGTDRESELDGALAILRRRFPAAGDDPDTRRRAYGVLLRKGYDPELAADALRAHAHAHAE